MAIGHSLHARNVGQRSVCQPFTTTWFGKLLEPATLARTGVPLAAILIPAGYFFSSAGRGATQPNRLILLIYAGAVALALGVVALGIGLLS